LKCQTKGLIRAIESWYLVLSWGGLGAGWHALAQGFKYQFRVKNWCPSVSLKFLKIGLNLKFKLIDGEN
jgi:hypothetical protein